MGLLDSLFGRNRSNVAKHNDRVWMCTETKFAEIQYDLSHRQAAAVLVVAHFEDTLRRLEGLLQGDQVPFRILRAADLNPNSGINNIPEDSSVDVLCAERHPLWSEDRRIVEFCESLKCRCALQYHVAVDSPLITRFIDIGILEQLGLRKTESIQSGMISRIIHRAQKQVEATAVTNYDASSAEEWFQKNLKDLRPKK